MRVPVYVRYMDDIMMAANEKDVLKDYVCRLDLFAQSKLRLELKPPLFVSSQKGIVFLGYRIMPYYYTLSGRSKRRFRSKLIRYEKLRSEGCWNESEYMDHILPLLSFVDHAESRAFRQACLNTI